MPVVTQPAKRMPYRIPTLKITRADAQDPAALVKALNDYSNDMQSFLQQLVATYNTHTQQK